MSETRTLLGNKTVEKSKKVTVTIPITGIPTNKNERADELAQFVGGVTPFHAYNHMSESKQSKWKRSVFQSLIIKLLKMPSNAGRTIEVNGVDGISKPNLSTVVASYANAPWEATKMMYGSLLPAPRRAEDFIFMHQPVNLAIQAVGLTAEIPLKVLGSVFSHPINSWFGFRKEVVSNLSFNNSSWTEKLKRIGAEIGFFALSPVLLAPWVVGQTFNTAGNLISYGREIVDSVAQGISSVCSIATGRYGTEHPTLGKSVKNFFKNAFLAIGGGIPLFSGALNSGALAVEKAVASNESPKTAVRETNVKTIHVKPKAINTAEINAKLKEQGTKEEISPLLKDNEEKEVKYVNNPLIYNDKDNDFSVKTMAPIDNNALTDTETSDSDEEQVYKRKPGVGPSATFFVEGKSVGEMPSSAPLPREAVRSHSFSNSNN